MEELELTHIAERNVENLSGGELQRFAIGVVVVQQADVYMFDEPSSYLDVKQRLQASRTIRSILSDEENSVNKYVLVVEHDLAVLDYLSDYICCLYGTPSAYGVVTMPFSVREGINIFLAGFVPTENLRFRDEELNFKLTTTSEIFDKEATGMSTYPAMTKTMRQATNCFKLHVEAVSKCDNIGVAYVVCLFVDFIT
jgi:ATP-binding cassette subfamily E protein 1